MGSIVLAYFFCMRVGEYAKTTDAADHAIRFSDITFLDANGFTATSLARANSVTVFFRSSKKDQAATGQARTLCRSGAAWCCPVITAWRMVANVRAEKFDSNSPLCVYRDKTGLKRVMGHDITKAIKRAAAVIGVNPRSYSSHSLRSGGATAMFLGGATDATVRLFGRWNSDAYLRYLHISTATTNNLSSSMLGQAGRND